MIDDRICIFYVADRIQDIVNKKSTAEEVLAEMIHNIGVNTRIKRNNPDALVADLPPIKPAKRGRKDWLSKRERGDLEEWKKKNPKFNENNIPKTLLKRLIWMHLKEVRQLTDFNQIELSEKADSTQVSISHVENGRSVPSLEVQLRIAHALGYGLEELIELMKNSIDWYKQEDAIAAYIKEQREKGSRSRPNLRKLSV